MYKGMEQMLYKSTASLPETRMRIAQHYVLTGAVCFITDSGN